MKRLLALIVSTAFCFTVCLAQPGKAQPTAEDLDQYLAQLYKAFYPDAVAPGIAVAVVKDSRVLLVRGFGYADVEAKRPVTPQTVFYIASSAKPFFALTAALLDHKTQIDLDAPLSKYLLGMKNTNTYLSRVKTDQLATPYHTGSGDYLRLYYAKADANMHAAGGIVTTAEDLAKWLLVNIDSGKLDGRQIFPSAVVAETHRLQVDQDTPFSWVRRYGYGLGWNIGSYEGETLIHHHGGFSAFYSHVSFMPKHRLGVAVLTNELVLGDAIAENVAQYIYDTLLDLPGTKFRWTKRLATTPQYAQRGRDSIAAERARRTTRQKPLPLPLEAYAGVYESAQGGRMEWRVQNGKLSVSIGPLFSEAEVYDAAKNELRIEIQPGRGSVVAFEVSGKQVVGVNFGNMKFKRVNAEGVR